MFTYLKNRIGERDTRVVILAACYTVLREMVPPAYHMLIDSIAGAVGVRYALTKNKL